MIHLPVDVDRLTRAQRWALEVMLDLAALPRVEDPQAEVVRLVIVGDPDLGGQPRSLTGARAGGWGIQARDGSVTLDVGTLSLVARIASAAEEQGSRAADRNDRVPPGENALVRASLETEPVLHEAAFALRRAVVRAAGRRIVRFLAPWPDDRRWAVSMTHDVDVVALWPAFAALRWIELSRGGHLGRVTRAVGSALRSALGDPVIAAVQRILAVESAHGVRATWFMLCGTPTVRSIRRGDLTYRPESRAARSIQALVRAAGHEIGLHGSFETMLDGPLMERQRERLAALTGIPVAGVRQHFLRMRPGTTQRAMADAGFTYDATFGFNDRNGFRLGVADVVGGFHQAETDEVLDLDVLPLVWMDRALSKYRGVERPEAWVDEALILAERCRAVNGVWTGLWHPNLTDSLGYPDAPAAFDRLVTELSRGGPFLGTAGEIVAWRSARRAVRISRIAADGRDLAVAAVRDARLRLEDAEGRPDAVLSRALHA